MEEVEKKIAQEGIILCYALFSFNNGYITEEEMNLYRDDYPIQILNITVEVKCPDCEGLGYFGEYLVVNCPTCKGTGHITKTIREIIGEAMK